MSKRETSRGRSARREEQPKRGLPELDLSARVPLTADEFMELSRKKKIALLMDKVKESIPGASLGNMLGGSEERNYAAVYEVHLGQGVKMVMKFLDSSEDSGNSAAILQIRNDQRVLKQGLPGLPRSLGAIVSTDDCPVCVFAEHIQGQELPDWIAAKGDRTSAEKMVLQLVESWESNGFYLVDHNPLNFLVTDAGSLMLIDAGGLSSQDRFVKLKGGAVVPAPISDQSLVEDMEAVGLGNLFEDADFDRSEEDDGPRIEDQFEVLSSYQVMQLVVYARPGMPPLLPAD